MKTKAEFILNADEFTRLRLQKRWGIKEVSINSGISRVHIYRLLQPADNKNHSRVGPQTKENLLKAFPEADPQVLFFLIS
jgi:hypothetical protein